MFLIFGIIVHTILGAGLRLAFHWPPFAIAAIFAAKELGELKYQVPGSVCTLEKNIAMLAALFTHPTILLQWFLPALAAWLLGRLILPEQTSRPNRSAPFPPA